MAKPELNNDMPFTATNYKLLLIGLAIVAVGYMLMSGGGNGDPNAFDAADLDRIAMRRFVGVRDMQAEDVLDASVVRLARQGRAVAQHIDQQ